MICPNCGRNIPVEDNICPKCGYRLATRRGGARRREDDSPRMEEVRAAARAIPAALWAVSWLVVAVFLALVIYRGYYWIQTLNMEKRYAEGAERAPVIDVVKLNDGRAAHAITFYGDEGDRVFIPQLRQTYMVVDGVARVEIPDSDWFDLRPEQIEAAEITITPLQTTEGGRRTLLPAMSFEVQTPDSPLTLISPKDGHAETYASIYNLRLQVVPGSTVLVDDKDVSDTVDRTGILEIPVKVYPVGDNNISLLVDTPHHRQTRQDITIYRAKLEIPLELTTVLAKSTTRNNLSISGITDPAAKIAVDTDIVEGSLVQQADGHFTFLAKFSIVGDNEIRFRSTMEGKQDSVISLSIYYLPPLSEYSRNAWKMDYDQLSKYYDTWLGRVFLCRGKIVDIIGNDPQLLVMNVGDDANPKLVVLENLSRIGAPAYGISYDAYADVLGNYRLDSGARVPYLAARYMSATKAP